MKWKNSVQLSLLVLLVFVPRVNLNADQIYYVSTSGNNSNPGTADFPFRTLEHARNVVRTHTDPTLTQNIFVNIEPGIYALTDTLNFDQRDSGTDTFKVTYRAADPLNKPQITGGSAITGIWHNHSGNVWYKNVPQVINSNWRFRQLYNGTTRQIRSREPDFDLDSGLDYGVHEPTVDPEYINSSWGEKVVNFPNTAEVLNFNNPERTQFTSSLTFPYVPSHHNCEIVTLGPWNCTRALITNAGGGSPFNPGTTIVCPSRVGVAGSYWKDLVVKRDFFLEHAYSFLDTNGEWFLDEPSGKLFYYCDTDPNNSNFFWAPNIEKIISV